MKLINSINNVASLVLNPLQPVLALGLRLWTAKFFVMSGLTKIKDMQTTKMLFEYEYELPDFLSFLTPDIAAPLTAYAELLLPALLVAGLFSRYAAVSLFILNLVAAISYPDISPAGTKEHIIFGIILLVLTIYGPGKLSLDWLLGRNRS